MAIETTLTRAESPVVSDTDMNVYDDGYLRVEHDNYYVSLGGRALKLPRKEFLIISRLARNAERIVPSAEIWHHGWGRRAAFNAESLHVHMYRLRRRLEPFGLQIETMVNVGYRLMTGRVGGRDPGGSAVTISRRPGDSRSGRL